MKNLIFILLLGLLGVLTQSSLDHCGQNGKITLNEFTFHYPIKLFTWLADSTRHYQTQVLTSHNGSLWHSNDEGISWEDITTRLPNWDEPFTPYRRHGVQWTYFGHQNPNVVYVKGYGPKLWVVKNMNMPSAQLTIENYESQYPFDSFLIHPARDDWLLAYGRTDRCFNRTAPGDCYRNLYLSQNYGKTWTVVDTYVFQASWGNAGINGTSMDNLFLLSFPDKTGSQFRKPRNQLEFIHTTDYLANKKQHNELKQVVFLLHSRGNTFLVQDETQGYSLLVSMDGGNVFYPAQFPFPQLSENQYFILDQSNGSVFVNIRHGGQGFSVSNTYSSQQLSHPTEIYDLSQENTVRNRGRPEFSRFFGIDGIYMSNQWQGTISSSGGEYQTSRVSFDVGGEWRALDIPVDEANQKIPCDEQNCQLNLFGETLLNVYPHQHGPLLTRSAAPGLMLATGNVGDSLETGAQAYFTRDGGWSWKQVYEHNADYQFADHGSLFALVDKESASVQDLRYSWDQGDSWVDCRFTNYGPMQFIGMFTEPGAVSQNFVIYGMRAGTKGAYVHVNMTGLNERACTDNDFEVWSPSDSRDEKAGCILGQTIAYTRRKRDAKCWVPREYVTETIQQSCACSREDYECDFCFAPDPITNQCVQMNGCDVGVAPPSPCNGSYNKSIGYRFVPGTHCDLSKTGAVNLLPVRTQCPTTTGSSTTTTTGPTTTGSSTTTTTGSSTTTTTGPTTTGSTTTGSSSTGPTTTGSSSTGPATTGSSSTGPATTGPISTTGGQGQNSGNSGGIGSGGVAAIVIVILLILFIIAAIFFVLYIKNKRPELYQKMMSIFSKKTTEAENGPEYSLVNNMDDDI